MKAFEEKKLEEIAVSGNKEDIENYYSALAGIKTNPIATSVVDSMEGESIASIWQEVFEAEQEYTSQNFFPGDLAIMYPNIQERHARNPITCDYSAGIIYPGSLYINYRPLIRNLSTGECYVLKRTLKVETGYQYNLPTTIAELEALDIRLQIDNYEDSSGIEYSHLSRRLGGKIILQKLKRRKQK